MTNGERSRKHFTVTPFPKNFTLSLEQTHLLEIVSSSESGTCYSLLILYAHSRCFRSFSPSFFPSSLSRSFSLPLLLHSLPSFSRSFYSQKKLIEPVFDGANKSKTEIRRDEEEGRRLSRSLEAIGFRLLLSRISYVAWNTVGNSSNDVNWFL